MTRKYFSSEKGTLEASATPFTPGLGYSPDIHVSLLNSTFVDKFPGIELDYPHDHIRISLNSNEFGQIEVSLPHGFLKKDSPGANLFGGEYRTQNILELRKSNKFIAIGCTSIPASKYDKVRGWCKSELNRIKLDGYKIK